MATEGPCVLDTSIAVGWFFTDEPLRKKSLLVRRDLADRPQHYIVPPLFHSELIHVLVRKSKRNEEFVGTALQLTLRLGLRTLLPSPAALKRTVYWACRGLSGYDATFLALAEDVGGTWLTADERAVKAAGRKHARALARWKPTSGPRVSPE